VALPNTDITTSALRAMISEFVFFIAIAAICFSGLLFTLWTLGTVLYSISLIYYATNITYAASDTWSISAIAWLMVQIWFGNTYLSFGQASSFHPFFGPVLMTLFACLANTLLLTSEWGIVTTELDWLISWIVLISILSNTVARIDAVSGILPRNSDMQWLANRMNTECKSRGKNPFDCITC
jgi:hypothetical protein